MALSPVATSDESVRGFLPGTYPAAGHSAASGVSWGAVFAGAAAAAALSLILLILGTGLGLSSVSPWAHSGVSATTFGVSTILWITLTQLLASGMGGYLAGRLRTKWVEIHTDEVYFRDTAHGFLAWAVASLATAALLTSVIGSIVGTGVQAGAAVVGGGTATAGAASATRSVTTNASAGEPEQGPTAYLIDALFRKDLSAQTTTSKSPVLPPVDSTASTAETVRIFANGIQVGALPPQDLTYLAQLVSQRTGLSQADAEKRVADTFVRAQSKLRETEAAAKEAADKARKASAYSALWLFISLLIGAFFASLSATYGGRRRDA